MRLQVTGEATQKPRDRAASRPGLFFGTRALAGLPRARPYSRQKAGRSLAAAGEEEEGKPDPTTTRAG
jgi:hypothetical protein